MKITSSADDTLASRLDVARNLAREVGREAMRFWRTHHTGELGIQTKGLQDFVTIADKQAEQTIRTRLAQVFPADGFIGEESGGEPGTAGFWVVDPIDGTANYLRGLRHWGVSIAYVRDGQVVLGVIHDAPNDRIYHARRGHGAMRDGVTIAVSETCEPHRAMGILGASRRTPINGYLDRIRRLHGAGIEHRKIGSAAVGIVRVAEGVADFYYEANLNCWDAMAALLICAEAGAEIIAPPVEQFIANAGEVFCATPSLAHLVHGLLVSGPKA